jgi:RNA polymerase sigma factor (sigma-70 family)
MEINYQNKIRQDYIKLSNDEMLELLKDLTPRNENILVKSMLPMAYQLANKYYYNPNFDDIIAAANQGILRGIRSFDPNNSFKATLVTFTRQCISNSISDYLKTDYTIRRPATYNKMTDDEKEVFATAYTYDDIVIFEKNLNEEDNNYNIIDGEQLREILNKLGKTVKQKHINVFIDYYINGLNGEEIGIKYGCTRQYVSQILNIVLNAIQEKPKIKEKLAELLF